jgi:hypothetical protein
LIVQKALKHGMECVRIVPKRKKKINIFNWAFSEIKEYQNTVYNSKSASNVGSALFCRRRMQ